MNTLHLFFLLLHSVTYIYTIVSIDSLHDEFINFNKIGIEMMSMSWFSSRVNLSNPVRMDNDHFVCYKKERPYYYDRKDNSTYSRIYNQLLRIIFYNACVNNSVPTTNHKTPFSNETELLMISLLDTVHQDRVEDGKRIMNQDMSYGKTSNLLGYLQMLFPRYGAVIENIPDPALTVLKHIRVRLNSCDVENTTLHREYCFHEELAADLKREDEEDSKRYEDWRKPKVTTTTTTPTINKDDTKNDKKKKPICRQTHENDVFYHFSCENASKMLVHSCFQKVTNGDMIKLINETGCPVDKDIGVMKYFGDTMAKAFFDGNTDVQCSFTTCQKDEDCEIKSPPYCREPHGIWT